MPQTRKLSGYWGWALAGVAGALSLFHLYTAFFGVLTPFQQRFTHLFGVLLIAFMAWGHGTRPSWLDRAWLVIALALGAYFFWGLTPERIMDRGFAGPSDLDHWAGMALIVLVLEASRRTLGWALVLVAGCFLAYAFAGPYLPEIIAHKGYSPARLMDYLVWSTDGVFGIPLAVSATFVMVFLIFGALMDQLGAGRGLLNLALAMSGRMRGGPAITAVAASGLMGSISGSAVSNVVTTGSITIPMMIKRGFSPRYSAAVEAVASTGGQIMPPVMGAAAFVLAEMAGVSYGQVALAAAVPAVLYFLCLAMMVQFHAMRVQLKPLEPSELPPLWPSLRSCWHLAPPLVLLVWLLLVAGRSPLGAGSWAVAALALMGVVKTLSSDHRLPWPELGRALVAAGRIAAPVAAACATAGIVIGVVGLTGLGVRFTHILAQAAGGQLWPTLFLMMIACIVLGAGLPTTAAYVITAVLGAPTLISLGLEPFTAHLFIFYFAIISFITPPVAISAFAAAGIAKAGPMVVGLLALRLGLAGFLVPFLFVYHPALILQGPWYETLGIGCLALAGAAALAGAMEGWFFSPVGVVRAGVLLLGALGLVLPGWWLPSIGLAVVGAAGPLWGWLDNRRCAATGAPVSQAEE